MLRVEVDLFSGRPNPVWLITDSKTSDQILGAVGEADGAAARPGTGFSGLGFREIRLSVMGDDIRRPRRVPREFALGSTAAVEYAASARLARMVLETFPRESNVQLLEHGITPLNRKLRDFLIERVDKSLKLPLRPRKPLPPKRPKNPLISTVPDPKCEKCRYEVSKFDPSFWNAASVQPYNNCYNYARNWRTNTFAQPGRAHGAQTGTMACNTVTTAAMADGLVKRCNCLPDSEYPRRLMALVIDPGWDYHWYRHQRGGFWGHKPGGTAARNYDNSNVVIANPETCNRGGYTDFCGYFYAGRSVVIN